MRFNAQIALLVCKRGGASLRYLGPSAGPGGKAAECNGVGSRLGNPDLETSRRLGTPDLETGRPTWKPRDSDLETHGIATWKPMECEWETLLAVGDRQ